ncbi:hypothetical protein Tco_1416414 [Tanacetum coccineum]
MAQQLQQQVIPADQLVTTKYQSIGRCNNYAMLLNIPCSAECKIFGILLVDHALSHALIATTDVPVMDTLQLPVENPFIVPTDLKYILRFLKIVGYEGIVDKEVSFISPRLEEDYHSIKDDDPLGSVYTTGNVTVRGMLSPSELLTDEICATKEYKAYEEKFIRDDVEKENKDDEKNDAEKNDDNDYHDDNALELTTNVSPTPDTTFKEPSMSQPTSSTCKILPGSVAIIKLTVDKTNELMKEAIPRMVNDAVNKDREIFTDVVPELLAKEFATHAPKILKELRNSRGLLYQPVQAKSMMHINENDGPPEGEKQSKS